MAHKRRMNAYTELDNEYTIDFSYDTYTECSGGFSATLVEFTDVSITFDKVNGTCFLEHLSVSNQKEVNGWLEYWFENERESEEQDERDYCKFGDI